MLLKLIKKNLNFFLKKSPRKVVAFKNLHSENIGMQIEDPENLTQILKSEKGSVSYFKEFEDIFNSNFVWRNINDKKRYKNGGIFNTPDRVLYSLENGIIFGSLGIVYEPENKYIIDESAKEWDKNLKENVLVNAISLPKIIKKDGIALSISTIGADGGFYHFLHEAIIKLWFCKEIIEHIDYLLVPGTYSKWKEKWLIAASIDVKKIIWLENTSHFQFSQLLFTNRLIFDQQINNWSVLALKSIYKVENIASDKPYRIIWSSRKAASHRVFQWEDKIKEQFPEIEFIDFTELSVFETIKICKETQLFLGPHGAGFSNLVFCEENTKVLEIFTNDNFQPCYNRLSQVSSLKYHAIVLDYKNPSSGLGLDLFSKVYNSIPND